MSKPADIPEDVWDAADVALDGILRAGDPVATTEVVARAILAERERCNERHRAAHTSIKNKAAEANSQRGREIQLRQAAERRERLLTINRDEWKARALRAEAHLRSLGVSTDAAEVRNERRG